MVAFALVRSIAKIPEVPRTLGGVAVSVLISWGFVQMSVSRGQKVPTMSREWLAAQEDYRKFQNMDPIFG